jgi:hypothetical protein
MSECEPCGKEGCSDCQGNCETGQYDKLKLALKTLNDNRAKGLKQLEQKVQDLLDSEVVNVEHLQNKDLVATLRDLAQGLNASLLHLESQNELVDMIVNDLTGLAMQFNEMKQSHFVTGAHLQTLISLMITKKQITEKQLRDTYTSLMQTVKQPPPE